MVSLCSVQSWPSPDPVGVRAGVFLELFQGKMDNPLALTGMITVSDSEGYEVTVLMAINPFATD